MVTVTGVSLRDPDAAAVLTAVQDATVLGGAHAAVRLVTSWWTTEETSAGSAEGPTLSRTEHREPSRS